MFVLDEWEPGIVEFMTNFATESALISRNGLSCGASNMVETVGNRALSKQACLPRLEEYTENLIDFRACGWIEEFQNYLRD